MVFYGKNDRVFRCHECMVSYCRDHVDKLDFCRESVSMIDQGDSFRSIPTVDCDSRKKGGIKKEIVVMILQ